MIVEPAAEALRHLPMYNRLSSKMRSERLDRNIPPGLCAGVGAALAYFIATSSNAVPLSLASPDSRVLEAFCRPVFTIDGAVQSSGTGFLLEKLAARRRTYLLSAQHLFSYLPDEIASHVTAAECKPPLSEKSYPTGAAISIPGAHPLGPLSELKDLSVFPVKGPSPGLVLAKTDVQPGDYVWLIAEVKSGRETSALLHRAQVGRSVGFLAYRFDDQSIGLDQTSGGAVVNALGEVVGLNVGYARTSKGDLIGIGDRLSTLQAVVNALP